MSQVAAAEVSEMRSVFFGTPAIAVPSLHALREVSDVVGVVCQPDRPAGRGMKQKPPAVKLAAAELGLEVHQPVKVKTGTLHEWLRDRRVEVAVVLAYGRILPAAVLQAPRHGCLNLHASLLPRYRGAAPINWALIRGETRTGISLMQMDEGLDTGPVYCQRELDISEEETAGELTERLAELAAEVVRRDLSRALSGELVATPQDEALATYAPPIAPEDARIDWNAPAPAIVNLVRGLAPSPGAYTTIAGKRVRVLALRSVEGAPSSAPGTIGVLPHHRLVVSTADGIVEIVAAQLQGRRVGSGRDLLNGRVLRPGEVLGG